MNNKYKKILIIGMAGGLANITAKLLLSKCETCTVYGVDARPIDKINDERITLKQMPYTRSKFEQLFRENEFDAVFHLGRMSHTGSNPKANLTKRLNLNLMGTGRILDLSLKFNIKKIIVLGTFHSYGALPDNSVFLNEDAPLRASMKYPDLLDIVEMDQIVTNWMWKHRADIETVLFRPCNIVGERIHNSICKYLKSSLVPIPVDYNPMMQFVHEFDMASILLRSLDEVPTGIYNVASDHVVSLTKAKKLAGTSGLPTPMFLASPVAYLLDKTVMGLPSYLVDYLKYSCLIDNSELKKSLGTNIFRFTTEDTLKLI